jgi:hypothetical protein
MRGKEAIVAHTLILHVENSEPIVGESDELPSVGDTLVQIRNPRRQDGRDLHYLAENSVMLYWPVHKLNFIEVVASSADEEVIGFVRE